MDQSSGVLSKSEMYLTCAYILFAFILLSLFVLNLKGKYGTTNIFSIVSWIVITLLTALLLYNLGNSINPEVVGGVSLCSSATLIISACLISM